MREGKRLKVKIKNRVAMMCFDVEDKRWKNIDDTLVHHWKWIKTTINLIQTQTNSFAVLRIDSNSFRRCNRDPEQFPVNRRNYQLNLCPLRDMCNCNAISNHFNWESKN